MRLPSLILPLSMMMLLVLAGCGGDKHVSAGKKNYLYYCAHCHGEKGQGNGVNARNIDPPPRDLTDALEPYMAESSNEILFTAIKEGVAGVHPEPAVPPDPDEGGSPLMPYWGYTLTDEQIWEVLAFIRTLHDSEEPKITFEEHAEGEEGGEKHGVSLPRAKKPGPFPPLDSPEGKAMAVEGKRLYEDLYSCAGCHRINGVGGEVAPDLSRAGVRMNPDWMYQWVQTPQSFRHETKMPAFNMQKEKAMAIVQYLRTLRATPEEAPGPPSGMAPTKG
ncbi:MAG TPA: cytochrome c [Nitrospiria bacterium]